jgi:hypothetical protein
VGMDIYPPINSVWSGGGSYRQRLSAAPDTQITRKEV